MLEKDKLLELPRMLRKLMQQSKDLEKHLSNRLSDKLYRRSAESGEEVNTKYISGNPQPENPDFHSNLVCCNCGETAHMYDAPNFSVMSGELQIPAPAIRAFQHRTHVTV